MPIHCADPVFRTAATRLLLSEGSRADGNDYLRFAPFLQHVQATGGSRFAQGRVSDVVANDPRSAPALERISTGIPELDEMLAGGLLPHRPYLVVGPPGSGKTTLALQFLIEGIRRGEEVLYVTVEEPPNEVRHDHQAMGPEFEQIYVFDAVPDVMRYERVPFKDISTVRESVRFGQVPFTIRQTPEFESVEVTMTSLQPTLRQEVRRRHYKRLVIDSLTALQFFCMPGVDLTQGAQTFLRFLSDLGTTTLLTLEVPSAEEESEEHLLARGELRLFRWEAEGKSQYAIGVEKFRGSSHDIHLHPYRMSPHGLDINLSVTIPSGGVASPAQTDAREVLGLPPEEVAYEIRRSVLNLDQDIRDLVEVGVDVKPMHEGVRTILTALADHRYDDALRRLRETRTLADRLIDEYHAAEISEKPKPPVFVPVVVPPTVSPSMAEELTPSTGASDVSAELPLARPEILPPPPVPDVVVPSPAPPPPPPDQPLVEPPSPAPPPGPAVLLPPPPPPLPPPPPPPPPMLEVPPSASVVNVAPEPPSFPNVPPPPPPPPPITSVALPIEAAQVSPAGPVPTPVPVRAEPPTVVPVPPPTGRATQSESVPPFVPPPPAAMVSPVSPATSEPAQVPPSPPAPSPAPLLPPAGSAQPPTPTGPTLVHRFFRRTPKPSSPIAQPVSRVQKVTTPTSSPTPRKPQEPLIPPSRREASHITPPPTPTSGRPPSTEPVPPLRPPPAAAAGPPVVPVGAASGISPPTVPSTPPAVPGTSLSRSEAREAHPSPAAPAPIPPGVTAEPSARRVEAMLPLPPPATKPAKVRRRRSESAARRRGNRPSVPTPPAPLPVPVTNTIAPPPPTTVPAVTVPIVSPRRAPKRKRKAPPVTGADPGRMPTDENRPESPGGPGSTTSSPTTAPVDPPAEE
jgi:KaiC/GvpD/RAD55 family RecA-like ATPase